MQCHFLKNDQQQCRAQAISETEYCFSHNPDYADERKLAQSRGGQARLHYQSYHEAVELKTPEDVMRLMNVTINALLEGRMPSGNPAGSLAYLSRCWLEAYDKIHGAQRETSPEVVIKDYSLQN